MMSKRAHIAVRAGATVVAFFVIGLVGVTAALGAATVVGRVTPMVVEFAYGWCTLPAMLLAAVVYGSTLLALRLWPRLMGSRVLGGLAARWRGLMGRFAHGATASTSAPAGFHADVTLPASDAPSPVALGVATAVPLAFLNLPGWLAIGHVVDGVAGGVAVFVVPGVVCGALTGMLIRA